MPDLAPAGHARLGVAPSGRARQTATPWSTVAAVGAIAAGSLAVATVPVDGSNVLRITGITAGLGSLLAVALVSAAPTAREGARHAGLTVLLVALGAAGAVATPVGAFAYFGTAGWLFWLTRRGALVSLGLGPRTSPRALAVGLALGATLGAHMLLSAQFTFGYRLLEGGLKPVLLALAYDAGVQVVATECFFRGALFNRLQRRASFAAACTFVTALTIARYLVDPQLPPAAELRAGAAFYTGLLSIGNCWLFWRFGTLVPGLGASLVFFTAYRLLTAR